MTKNGSATITGGDVKLVLNGSKNNGLLSMGYALQQNYPNPFTQTISIDNQFPGDGRVIAKIYDVIGNEARVLVDDNEAAGFKSAE